MRGLIALAALAALGVPGEAAAAVDDPAALGPSVAREVVVDASDRLDVAQAGRLRVRIAERALGRIRLAVVDDDAVSAAGGIAPYANAVSDAMDPPLRGALVVVAPQDAYVVTSYLESARAVAALQRAFAAQDGDEAGALLRAVDGLAEADPGADADVPVGQDVPGVAVPGPPFDVGGISDAIKIVLYAAAAALLLPVLAGISLVTTRSWRRRRAEQTEAASALDEVRDDLARLAGEIVDREPDSVTPEAARDAYAAALKAYEEASGLLLGEAPDKPTVRRARVAVDDGFAAFGVAGRSASSAEKPLLRSST